MSAKSDFVVWCICGAIGYFVYWIADSGFAVQVLLGLFAFSALYKGIRATSNAEGLTVRQEEMVEEAAEQQTRIEALEGELAALREELEGLRPAQAEGN
ncbi:hypothetical protein [Cupriavidus gilardii]|uniref:hypothetical protein n=1 Tax=Cupriavidus gilardii TaxID=82541 RepID=UPI0021C0C1AE|nr:hypothetical protein [Cupriavidus gilardii]MCT9123124.1 hypothetical protein [Cupriavidus gilardii]